MRSKWGASLLQNDHCSVDFQEHPVRVLFVDSDIDFAERYAIHACDQGYETISAENGVVGLKMFMMMAPDVVVITHEMQGMKGADLAREIRLMNSTVPILLLTGRIRPRIDARLVGLFDYAVRFQHDEHQLMQWLAAQSVGMPAAV